MVDISAVSVNDALEVASALLRWPTTLNCRRRK